MQFSLRLRLSLADVPATRLVFIQYLFALAVVEACRDDSVLGGLGDRVRIKWPNDVYVTGHGEENRTTKVAGILVYTTFSGSDVDVVIGLCLACLSIYVTIEHFHRLWAERLEPTSYRFPCKPPFSRFGAEVEHGAHVGRPNGQVRSTMEYVHTREGLL